MNLDEILKQLTHPPKKLPREALCAADQYRGELTPRLLASLADLSTHPELLDKDPENQLPFIAMYLLAVWREPQAHPLLIKFLRLPGDRAIDLSGDMVTQDMLWMLVQTCAGDTSQIEALVVDRKVGEWSRGIAVNALTLFTQQGGQSEEALGEQFRRIIETLREYDSEDEFVDSTPLSDVACSVLDLQLVSLRTDVLMLFDTGRINKESITREEFDKELGQKRSPIRAPVTDIVKALSWWDFDSNMSPRTEALMDLDKYEDAVNAFVEKTDIRIEETVKRIAQQRGELVPYRAPAKLGRNDPCSCGSGKKYKKCCGA